MQYTAFRALYLDAAEERNPEMFLASLGWQDWMDGMDAGQIADIVNCIHTMAGGKIADIRNFTGLSQVKFGIHFGIPRRTIEAWESGQNDVAAYLACLLSWAVFCSLELT